MILREEKTYQALQEDVEGCVFRRLMRKSIVPSALTIPFEDKEKLIISFCAISDCSVLRSQVESHILHENFNDRRRTLGEYWHQRDLAGGSQSDHTIIVHHRLLDAVEIVGVLMHMSREQG